ncbi:MAG: hypothetical protein JNL82_06620 [Myxococcales bacterium]|nr:hypothetical protein [Myxococcales bacterium]
MVANNWLVPGAVVVGGGLVAAIVLWLGAGEAARPEAARPEAVAQAQVAPAGGVRPAEVDPARRMDLDPRAGDDPPPLPAARPAEPAPDEDERRAAPPVEPPPPPPPLTEEQVAADQAATRLREQVAKAVGEQLGERRAALRKACWKDTGGASAADFSVNASFDADGKLTGMGISDIRGPGSAATAGVGQCLRSQVIPLNIEPPGQGVTVDVALRMP